MLLAVLVVAGLIVRELVLPSPAPLGLVGASASTTLSTAATRLEEATRTSGAGFSFTVVSRSTLYARPGGPKIEVPDPNDRYKTLGLTDEYYVNGNVAEGIARPDGFWIQMRDGPASKEAPPDFGNAVITMAALTRGDQTWRDDGKGWYPTDRPPGIGLDVATLTRLPSLLRNATSARLDGSGTVDGRSVTKVSATGSIADAPGLMAIDAAAFSELSAPIEYAVDTAGRLAQLHAKVRNLQMETFDLIVDVTVTFRYDPPPGALPETVATAPPFDDLPQPTSAK